MQKIHLLKILIYSSHLGTGASYEAVSLLYKLQRNTLVPMSWNSTQFLCGRPPARRTALVFVPVTQHFSSCEGNAQYCSSTRMTIQLAGGREKRGRGEGRREAEETLLYNLLQHKTKNSSAQQALQGSARTAVIRFIRASLFPVSTGIAGAHCYKKER